MEIAILLSTYNGENYLEQLLTSLVNQNTKRIFSIHIRDDGSTDSTQRILKSWQARYPELIVLRLENNIGTANSFDSLLKTVNSRYFLWCDQDDLWAPTKVERCINKIKNLEVKYSVSFPLLLVHDMRIINENGESFNSSFFNLCRLRPSEIHNGIFQGFIPGCSMVFNHACKLEYIRNKRINSLHDYHLQLVAYLSGTINVIPDKLISYRLHENNQIGLGKNHSYINSIKDFIKYILRRDEYNRALLSDYLIASNTLIINNSNDLLNSKELYTYEKITKLHWFNKKKWFLRHFKPFDKGMVEGIVRLCLI